MPSCLPFKDALGRWVAVGLLTSFVVGCGGGSDRDAAPVVTASQRAQHVVSVTETANLFSCLVQLTSDLNKSTSKSDINLGCAVGTYRGQTANGSACELQVDGDIFRFKSETGQVDIGFADVAHTTSGRPVHNLEDASAPAQPGVQLTRFTGAPEALTESLILRFGTGMPKLPKMIYQRTAGGATSAVTCMFGR